MSEQDDPPPEDQANEVAKITPIPMREFLEAIGVSQWRSISDLTTRAENNRNEYQLHAPEVTLFCSGDICRGPRTFRCTSGQLQFFGKSVLNTFLDYHCSNCRSISKRFALQCIHTVNEERAYKYGESPAFGPPTPPRLLRLFGKDKELFLKGRRCESQGLGIGAFSYYRRVVESHKDQILDEIIRVSKVVGLPQSQMDVLLAAKQENQFARALESVKDALPQTLLVRGHNPLTLLHGALSGGLHGKSDTECLELAHAVRMVLIELAEKMAAALNDEAELSNAVSRLMQSRS